MTVPVKNSLARTNRKQAWTRWPRERLLDTPIRDLHLGIEGSPLESCIARLFRELDKRSLIFRPHFWLSDEWFCPDGVPGVAIPFFLAHPKLRRLELDFMLEVEGGNRKWCMKLFRHETGHALLNAYKLAERRDWRQFFGRPNTRYPDTYLPKPYSKRFVMNLPNWYAQSHPHEDWAETFAVWLQPDSDWRKRYRSWPAFRKLQYVDGLMREIGDKKPLLRNKRVVASADTLRMTLREYYADKSERFGNNSPDFFDRDLRKLFVDNEIAPGSEKASHYIRRMRNQIITVVERWTSEYKYRINEVLNDMARRCDELKLRVVHDDDTLKTEMVACLTMLVMNKLHSEGFHISL
jgi:hypothetical protein